MIDIVAFVIEFIVAAVVAALLFIWETGTNFSPIRNFRRACGRVKQNVKNHQLD